ncbi:MAG: diaminopimelate epimerase [Thermodesulfobacteriota bacterium]
MERIRFCKMHGCGNDFIIIDNRQKILDGDQIRDLVIKVCRRKISVGADGLILIEPSARAHFRWRFFNADGSEAEMCGNAGRCAARFAVISGIAPASLTFETKAGIIAAEVMGRRVKLQMTKPFGLELDIEVPVDGEKHLLDFLNTGVPHAVKFVSSAASIPVKDLGRKIRFHPRFQPAGTNVNFVQPLDGHQLQVRTYERGVEDETLACGTGAIASALIAAYRGLVTPPVAVKTSGGEILNIYFQKEGKDFKEVFLEGDTTLVYEGILGEEAFQ